MLKNDEEELAKRAKEAAALREAAKHAKKSGSAAVPVNFVEGVESKE